MQKRRGFTTVELVIVIAVIAILATALIPTFGGLIAKANHTADVQTAKNLTTVLMTYSMDHKITSDHDLARAINEAMNDPTYYQNLQAKSAKDGYCFWYDYENYTVELGTIEEITALSQDPQRLSSLSDWDITLSGENNVTTFSAGIRTDLVEGFVLMGYKGNNELMNLVLNLENASLETYGSAYKAVLNYSSENTAMTSAVTALKNNLKNTLIHNNFGKIVPAEAITNVYIPLNISEINAEISFKYDIPNDTVVSPAEIPAFANGATVFIPTGTRLSTGSLGYLNKNCTVNINVSAEELPAYVDASATDAIIRTNDDRYFYLGVIDKKSKEEDTAKKLAEDAIFKLLGAKEYYIYELDGPSDDTRNPEKDTSLAEIEKTNTLSSYALSVSGGSAYAITNAATKTGSIYLPAGQSSVAMELVANTFLDQDGNSTNHGYFVWTVNGETVENATGVNCNVTVSAGDVITAETLELKYTFTVKTYEVKSLGIFSIAGTVRDFTLNYIPGIYQSWTFVPKITYTDGLLPGMVPIDDTITLKDDTSNAFDDMFELNNGKLYFKGNTYTEVADTTGSLTFMCAGKECTIEIKLVDKSSQIFSVAPNADRDYTLVVGTYNKVPLNKLFNRPTLNGKTVIVAEENGETVTIDATNIANYNNLGIQLSTSGTTTVSMYYADTPNTKVSVQLNVVSGAYNVANAEDWAAYKANNMKGTDIAILDSFTIDGKNHIGNATTQTAGLALKYALDIGSGDVYGNLKTINVINFIVKSTYPNNYIISAGSGSIIDRLIITGPDYGSVVTIDNDGAISDGTFVTAVKAAGGTDDAPVKITNCFLSGFRSPLWANGGKTVVEGTTLHLGNYANLYVDTKTTLELNSVTTVQYETASGSIGGGISYKHSAGPNQVLKATNLTQYNFLTQEQIAKVVEAAARVVPISISIEDSDLDSINVLKHQIGSNKSTYYHMGITIMDLTILDAAESVLSVLGIGNVAKNNPATFATLEVTYSDGGKFSRECVVEKKVVGISAAKLHIYGIEVDEVVEDWCFKCNKPSSQCKWPLCCTLGCDKGAKVECNGGTCDIGTPHENTEHHIDKFFEKFPKK